MAYIRLSAAEAAAMIKDQDTIALSGFTPNGVPKATLPRTLQESRSRT